MDYIDPVKKPQQAKAAGYRRDVNILVDSGARKEEAKSLTEEEVTGALIRSQKSGERNVCFVNAAGEHSIDDEGRTGYSLMKQFAGARQLQDPDHRFQTSGRRTRQAARHRPGAGRGGGRSPQGLPRHDRRRAAA